MKDRKISDGQWDEIRGIFQFLEPFSSLLVLHLIRLHSSWHTHKKELTYDKDKTGQPTRTPPARRKTAACRA